MLAFITNFVALDAFIFKSRVGTIIYILFFFCKKKNAFLIILNYHTFNIVWSWLQFYLGDLCNEMILTWDLKLWLKFVIYLQHWYKWTRPSSGHSRYNGLNLLWSVLEASWTIIEVLAAVDLLWPSLTFCDFLWPSVTFIHKC